MSVAVWRMLSKPDTWAAAADCGLCGEVARLEGSSAAQARMRAELALRAHAESPYHVRRLPTYEPLVVDMGDEVFRYTGDGRVDWPSIHAGVV